MSLLEAAGVRKSFEGTEVLRGINLRVERGDVVAILGPSGSGKTTFLRCLNFLERADKGEMTFDGTRYDLAHADKREIAQVRMHTGFVFQSYNLFRNKTVLRNVTLGLEVARKRSRKEAEAVAREMLQHVGMLQWEDAYPSQLSGGQQQRVAIARALAQEPDILFFDEPTSALDPELIGEVLAVMRQLAEDGMTMLVVTHEMDFARNVSNRVLFMEHGEVVEENESHAFFENPRTERSRAFVQSVLGFGKQTGAQA